MISGIFGLPGSGKSVFLSKCAHLALRGKPCRVGKNTLHTGDYDYILTNFDYEGTYRLDWEKLGVGKLRNALLIIDELQLFADSRQFKSFADERVFFFSEHRKMHCDVIWASQTYDGVDKKIRSLTQKYYLCTPATFFSSKFTVISPISMNIDVISGNIIEGYDLAPTLERRLCYMPKYWTQYDTDAIISHKSVEIEKYPLTKWR